MRPLLPAWTWTRNDAHRSADRRARICVVDDEPQIRELLASALRREGYEVETYDDGRKALLDMESSTVDVLITDLRMPAMNGLDLIQAAKNLLPDLASILITAFASTETAVEALRSGADDYLTKPFRLEDLRKVVTRVIDAGRMARDEQAAVQRARTENDALREQSTQIAADLQRTRADLSVSRRALEERVQDLEFMHQFTEVLAREEDLDRMLQTTARILSGRFAADVTRIELDLGEGVRIAEHQPTPTVMPILKGISSTLLQHACLQPDGIMRDAVLGYGQPLEALAVVLRLAGSPVGGLTMLRRESRDLEAAGDLSLLALVPQALSVALEGQANRRAAERNALGVAERIIEALENRGSLFAGHSQRVARLASSMCGQMGLSARLTRVVELAARLHDVGEVGVPDTVLLREGPLDEGERSIIRLTPVIGAQILAPFGEAAAFVRHHHERPDGLGYPDRLREGQIPLGASIIGVAEAYDAMTSSRPYRPSMSRREALAEVNRGSGTQFVMEAADALLSLPREQL